MTSLPVVTLDDVLKYATRENLIYLFGGLFILKLGEWTYWPIRKLFSPLRHLPGPKNENLLFGNLKRIFGASNSVIHEAWLREYGTTFTYRGFLSVRGFATHTACFHDSNCGVLSLIDCIQLIPGL